MASKDLCSSYVSPPPCQPPKRLEFTKEQISTYMISCLLCGQKTPLKSAICDKCIDLLPYNDTPCIRCSLPVANSSETISDTICEACFKLPPPYMACISPFLYQFPVDQLISRMKLHNQPQLSKVLADLMSKGMNQATMLPEALIPIPMHPKQQRQRGYNQAIYLANHLSKRYKIPVLQNTLIKTKVTESQKFLTADQRKQNLKNAFRINPRKAKRLSQFQHVAIVDDVITTGATIEEACRCLKQFEIELIDVWAIARTP